MGLLGGDEFQECCLGATGEAERCVLAGSKPCADVHPEGTVAKQAARMFAWQVAVGDEGAEPRDAKLAAVGVASERQAVA